MAESDPIPDGHHVLRHVQASKIEQDGTINGAAFKRRASEDGLSVAWREITGHWAVTDQIGAIRAAFRLEVKKSHRFAELPVGRTREYVREGAAALATGINLRFEHAPLEAEGGMPEDPFHSEIFGTPPEQDHLLATAIGDLIAKCVSETYPGIA